MNKIALSLFSFMSIHLPAMEAPSGKIGATDADKTAYMVISNQKARQLFSSNIYCTTEPNRLVKSLKAIPVRFHDACKALLDAKCSYYYWQEKIYELVSEFNDPELAKVAREKIQKEQYFALYGLIIDDVKHTHNCNNYTQLLEDLSQYEEKRKIKEQVQHDRDTLTQAIDRINCIKKTGRICRSYVETMRILGYVKPLHQQDAAVCPEWGSSKYVPFPIDVAKIIAYHRARLEL